MSIITPLLDTLLHDVLGRRMPPPGLRTLDETVTPLRPAPMLNPGEHEAMVDMRRAAVQQSGNAPLQTGTPRAGPAALLQGGALPQGVQASLSPVARVIAEVLGRFPAPASVLRMPMPLIPHQATVPSVQLATQLQFSVNDSGLFYEAHLGRWYRGTLPLAQLQREPQMQLAGARQAGAPTSATSPTITSMPAALLTSAATSPGLPGPVVYAAPVSAAFASAGLPTPTPATGLVEALIGTGQGMDAARVAVPGTIAVNPGLPGAAPALAQAAAADTALPQAIGSPREFSAARPLAESMQDPQALQRHAADPAEAVQGIVRHQLELLSVPVLRWEGDVWAGLFMQLVIQLPDPGAHGDSEGEDKGAADVESEVTINLHSLGELNAKLRLQGDALALVLSTESARCLDYLQSGREALALRLRNCGFSAPTIQIKMAEAADTDE